MKETSLRVVRILDRNRAGGTRMGKFALASMSGFLLICTFTMPRVPELVGFEDAMPTRAASFETAAPLAMKKLQPMVVAASFHPAVATAQTAPSRTRASAHHSITLAPREHVVPAKAKVLRQPEPLVVRAGLRKPATNLAAPIVVLTETTTFMQSQGVLWKISVVKWTILPRVQLLDSGVPPKAI